MKKIMVGLMALFIAVLAFPMGAAQAQQIAADATITASASPEELSEPGLIDVTVQIKIKSGSYNDTVELLALTIDGHYVTETSGIILASGATKSFTLEDLYLTEDKLDSSLEVCLIYYGFDGKSQAAYAYFAVPTAAPEVAFTREISNENPVPYETVTITYTVENKSGVPLRNIVVTDTAINKTFTAAELEAREKKTFTVDIAQDVVSEPAMSYCYGEPEETAYKSIPSAQISVRSAALAVELTAPATQIQSQQDCMLVIRVTNLGQDALENITLSCDYIPGLAPIKTLAPQETYIATAVINPISSHEYTVRARCGDVTVDSQALTVEVEPADQIPSALLNMNLDTAANVALDVAAKQIANEKNGSAIEFTITIHSIGSALTDVTVMESSLGEVFSADTVTGSQTFTYTSPSAEIDEYTFMLDGISEDGIPVVVISAPVQVPLSSSEPLATLGAAIYQTKAPSVSRSSTSSTLLVVFLCLATVALAAFIVVCILYLSDKRKRRENEQSDNNA